MRVAVISVLALLLAIGVSMFSRINMGLISIALAWLVGVHGAGMQPDAVMGGIPACWHAAPPSIASTASSPL
jgi:hypothetical protein